MIIISCLHPMCIYAYHVLLPVGQELACLSDKIFVLKVGSCLL